MPLPSSGAYCSPSTSGGCARDWCNRDGERVFDFPLGDSLEVFIRREDAERFIEEVRGDDPEIAVKLRIEERELEAGGLN